MHILHICSDFLGTTAHISLFKELDKLGIVQTVFVPVNYSADISRRTMKFKTSGSQLIFSRRQKRYHKFLYGFKIKWLKKDILNMVDLSTVDLIHSAVMCNEGAVAYEIHKRFHIPYISAVRNSDINSYMRIFWWRKGYFKNIAKNAERIIFISSQYPNRLQQALSISRDSSICKKFEIIHNGLQDFYLENINREKKTIHTPCKVVITGAFVKNKNIHSLFEAIKNLRAKGVDIELSAIGDNLGTYISENECSEHIRALSASHEWFKTFNAQPKEELFKSLRKYDIFALISFQETFGLSYLEALSQGLPIIYTKDEGFDGTYPAGYVGNSAIATDIESIEQALLATKQNYDKMTDNLKKVDFEVYRWSNIACRYMNLYSNLCNK